MILWVNMANFHNEKHGRLVGLIMGLGFLGTMVLNVLYTKVFSPNLSCYFTMISIATGVTFSLGIIFNVKVETVSSYEPIEFKNAKEDTAKEPKKLTDKPFWKCGQLYILLLFCGIEFGIVNAQLLWFSTYVESLGFKQYMATILSISPLVSAVGVILIGFLSDAFLDHYPRMNIYCLLNLLMTIVLAVSIFFLHSLVVLIVLAIANGCMLAASNCLVLAELHMEYGEEAFGTTMGIFYFFGTTMVFICQYIASALYDRQLHKQHATDNICKGSACFYDWTAGQTTLFAFCVFLNFIYIYKRKCIKNSS